MPSAAACSSLLTIMHGGSGGEGMSNKSFLIFISFEDRMLTQSSIFGHAISVGVLSISIGKRARSQILVEK